MGKIFIFIGQFGNQIGLKLMTATDVEENNDNGDVFITVDTENKVINSFKKKLSPKFNGLQEVTARKGRGSNWSMGYNLQCDSHDEVPLKQKVLKLVQRKLERSPELCGFIVIHSLIGGTGGGLGSAIMESLKEEHHNSHITSITTSPFVSGESPLQHYNALLTLAWLQRYTDNVMIFHNDDVMNDILKNSRSSTGMANAAKVSIEQLNDSICFSITNLMYPFSRGGITSQPPMTLQASQQSEAKCFSCKLHQAAFSNKLTPHDSKTPCKTGKLHLEMDVSASSVLSSGRNTAVKDSIVNTLRSDMKKVSLNEGSMSKQGATTVCKMQTVPQMHNAKYTIAQNHQTRTRAKSYEKRKLTDASPLSQKKQTSKAQVAPDQPSSGKMSLQKATKNDFCTCIKNNQSQEMSAQTGFFSTVESSSESPFDDSNLMLRYLTPNPNLKFISSYQKQSKAISSDYKKILMSILRQLAKSDISGNKYKNAAAVLIARGECFKVFQYERDEVINIMKQKMYFSSPENADLWTSPVCVPGYIYPQALTLHVNNSRNADFLDHVITKASLMFEHSAYLHWYSKFGCTKDYFEEAFETLANVVQEYRSL